MKIIIRIFLTFAPLLFVVNTSLGQHWQDSTVAIPESVFPIGGIPFGLGDFHDSVNSLKEAGFNMDYERQGDYGIIANIKAMTHGLVGYMSMGGTLNSYIGNFPNFFPGSERRFFLASNETGIYAECDTANTWGHKAGTRSSSTNNEWQILSTDSIIGNGNYVLTDLQVASTQLDSTLGYYITWPQTDSAFCDFIFRIDTNHIPTSAWGTARYSIEYYLKDTNNTVSTFFDTITITKQLAFLQDPNRDKIEHKHIIKYPDTTQNVLSHFHTEYYSRIRRVLPIHAGSFQAKTLEVKLRTFHTTAPLFIRGLRIRSNLAEQVLTGQKDSTLDTLFRAIRDTLNNNHIDSNTRFITAGGETQTPNFRVYSYLDDRCNKKIGKHIVHFLTNSGPFIKYPWYRSIYEDQTDSIPPPLQAECMATFYGYAGEITPVPRDCIPDSIFNLPHFTMLGAQVLPVADSSYTHYTNVFQSKSGWCSKFEESQATYPPGKTPGKWYGMLAGLLSFDYLGNAAKPMSTPSVVRIRDSAVARMKRGILFNANDSLYYYQDLIDSSLLGLSYRVPFRTEMRADGWDAIAFGAKGIYWNALGNDRSENVGITDIGLNRSFDFDSTKTLLTSPQIGSCSDPFIPETLWDDHIIYRKRVSDNQVDSSGWIPTSSSQIQGLISANATMDSARCADSVQVWISQNGLFNSSHYWVPVMVPGCDTSRWAAYFKVLNDKGYPFGIWDNNNNHWPYTSWAFNLWVPTFYGFKERWNAAKRFSLDIIPIAPTLSTLDWQDAFFYDEQFVGALTSTTGSRQSDSMQALSAWSKFPLKEVKSNKINRYTVPLTPLNQYDSANTTLVELGLFSSKTDSGANYIVVSNHRTWPLYYKADGSIDTSQGRMGAIDARQVELHFDKSKFDSSFSAIRVTNMRTNKDSIIGTDSVYKIILEPGEGTLLRIAPAVGLDLGEMADNLYNNGRHIAAVDTGSPGSFGVKQFLTTYQRNGNIYLSLPVETPSGSEKRVAGIPSDSLIDSSGTCFNPSIAYNHRNNTIGITYRKVLVGCDTCPNDTTLICFRRASYSNPYHFSAMKVVDTVYYSVYQSDYLSIPSIAPRDTSHIDSLKYGEFWVAYTRQDSGVGLRLIDTNGNVIRRKMFWSRDRGYAKFVSIATHVPYDTVRLAFEDDFNFVSNGTAPEIYYEDCYLNNSGALQISNSPPLDLSSNLSACQNHCPQVAIHPFHKATIDELFDQPELVSVGWEAMNTPGVLGTPGPGSPPTVYQRYAVVKRRYSPQNWSPYLIFHAGTFSSATHTGSQRILVNLELATSIPHTIFGNAWHDWERFTWNDLNTGQISIARYGFYVGNDGIEPPYVDWYRYHYNEPAQEPAMPNLSYGDLVVHPFLYRNTTPKDDGLYDARIIRYNFPSSPVTKDPITGIINALATPGSCDKIMSAKMGNIKLVPCCDTVYTIDLHGLTDSMSDPNGFKPVGWDDKKGVRTFAFHTTVGELLKYQRNFRVGAYNAGDTMAVAANLIGSNDFIRARIYLRRAVNDSIIAILDSARLKLSGFVQSGSLVDSGWKVFSITFSDSVYLTMEMSRGDSTNPFMLARIEVHGDDIYDSFAPPDTSYKKADPTIWQPSPIDPEAPINVSVIPNPFYTSAQISVDVPLNITLNVALFDGLGRKVVELVNGPAIQSHSEFTLSSQTLSSGFYYLRVQSGSQVVTRKIQLIK